MTDHRRTKIIATLGPASSDYQTINALFDAGVSAFRLNFSHGNPDDHRRVANSIRQLETKTNRSTCIIGDLQGPKLRIGIIKNHAAELAEGNSFVLDRDQQEGSHERVELPHPEIFHTVKPGDALLLDDGKIKLDVTAQNDNQLTTQIRVGGTLRSHKGINLPGVFLPIPALTEKDRADLEIALDIGVDWIAQSFVQRAEDIAELQALIKGRAGLIAKLEKPQALHNLEAIIALSDAIMIARGDLGIELSVEDVPPAQKQIIDLCRVYGKPTIVATQMLESMITQPTPTRAEASDVANAVYDCADAVMLSAETAIGAHPVETAKMMDRIVRRIESDPRCRRHWNRMAEINVDDATAAIIACIGHAAQRAHAASIASYTTSGATALRVANFRPETTILALTPSLATWRKLGLVWGIYSIMTEDATSVEDMVNNSIRCAHRLGFAAVGDRIVISAGIPFGQPGKTNLIRIAEVENPPGA